MKILAISRSCVADVNQQLFVKLHRQADVMSEIRWRFRCYRVQLLCLVISRSTFMNDVTNRSGLSKMIMVLVNGSQGSAVGGRARGLFESMGERYEILYLYRDRGKLASLAHFLRIALSLRPDLIYVIDTAVSGAGAALLAHHLTGQRFVVDTGDFGYELAVLTRTPGWAGRRVIGLVESLSLRLAEAVVVRGTFHKRLLERDGLRTPMTVMQDGIHPNVSYRRDATALRQSWGIDDETLCVGVMGSLRWNAWYRMCYGWDLIEALAHLDPTLPVRALVVGDGDGLPHLETLAQRLGVMDRVQFVGRVPLDDVPLYVSAMDVALSTQTDNRVGWARTTGKLPEYMAAGCYVLATDVGEAHLLLPPEMRLPYQGVRDDAYPKCLAQKILELVALGRPSVKRAGLNLVDHAHNHLDYKSLSSRLDVFLENILRRSD